MNLFFENCILIQILLKMYLEALVWREKKDNQFATWKYWVAFSYFLKNRMFWWILYTTTTIYYYNYILDAFLSSFKSFSTTTSQKVAMSDNYNNVIMNDFKKSDNVRERHILDNFDASLQDTILITPKSKKPFEKQ